MKKIYFPLITILLFSCGQESKKDEIKDEPQRDSDTAIAVDTSPAPIRRYAEGMREFTNVEGVEYCLVVPFDNYEETFEEDLVKGMHRFKHTKDKGAYFNVQGLERSDKNILLQEYFKNTYTEEAEAEGKVIMKKAIVPNINAFYAMGFWNNLGNKYRFTEMTWLRKDDVVVLYGNYPIADTAQWTAFLESFKTYTSTCP